LSGVSRPPGRPVSSRQAAAPPATAAAARSARPALVNVNAGIRTDGGPYIPAVDEPHQDRAHLTIRCRAYVLLGHSERAQTYQNLRPRVAAAWKAGPTWAASHGAAPPDVPGTDLPRTCPVPPALSWRKQRWLSVVSSADPSEPAKGPAQQPWPSSGTPQADQHGPPGSCAGRRK
jgi:hypothetical protein